MGVPNLKFEPGEEGVLAEVVLDVDAHAPQVVPAARRRRASDVIEQLAVGRRIAEKDVGAHEGSLP